MAAIIIGLIVALVCLWWIGAEQAEHDRRAYDPRKERKE